MVIGAEYKGLKITVEENQVEQVQKCKYLVSIARDHRRKK